MCIFSVVSLTARTNQSQHVPPQPKTYPPPLLFSILTHFLSLFLSLYSSLALPSKSKSCVTIATAAVCENYLNPSLFFLHRVFPVTFNGYCFDVGTHNQVEGGWKRKKTKKNEEWGSDVIGEQQSRAAEQKEERRD